MLGWYNKLTLLPFVFACLSVTLLHDNLTSLGHACTVATFPLYNRRNLNIFSKYIVYLSIRSIFLSLLTSQVTLVLSSMVEQTSWPGDVIIGWHCLRCIYRCKRFTWLKRLSNHLWNCSAATRENSWMIPITIRKHASTVLFQSKITFSSVYRKKK